MTIGNSREPSCSTYGLAWGPGELSINMSISVVESSVDSLDRSDLDVWALDRELSSTSAVPTADLASLSAVDKLELGPTKGRASLLELSTESISTERSGNT